jgi:hypothetical protein
VDGEAPGVVADGGGAEGGGDCGAVGVVADVGCTTGVAAPECNGAGSRFEQPANANHIARITGPRVMGPQLPSCSDGSGSEGNLEPGQKRPSSAIRLSVS